jgi:nucleotide-binding universal stress UspA family protein
LHQLVPGIRNGLEQRAIDDRREELMLLGGSLSELHGVQEGTNVDAGPAFVQVEKRARDMSDDLAVVGTHGMNILTRPSLGSRASRMAERSDFPVLVVKQEPRERYRNVLVPVDFSEYSLPALMTALVVAPEANILLMHAHGVPFEGKLRAARVLEKELTPFLAAARKKVCLRICMNSLTPLA